MSAPVVKAIPSIEEIMSPGQVRRLAELRAADPDATFVVSRLHGISGMVEVSVAGRAPGRPTIIGITCTGSDVAFGIVSRR